MRLKPIADQVIVVTGASSGIGLATASLAAGRGAKVFLIARNGPALQAISDGLNAAGGQTAFAVADVGVKAQIQAAAEAAVARFGTIDSWISVAGVAVYASVLDTPPEEHARMFQTNYGGVIHGAQAAVPILRQHGGAFIAVGSVASDIGTPVLGLYAASKHAVKGFIDSLRIELISEGAPISVTLVKPSGIGSPLAEHAANHLGVAARVPPPAYAPEVVARALLHVAEHPRREITVGGVGLLQILAASHAPRLADRISSWVPPLLRDRTRPAPPANNLEGPMSDGMISSPFEPALPFSLYTNAALNPVRALTVLATVGAVLLAVGKAVRIKSGPS
ncbi:MAG TPA: SDR family oxidoreductase [Brevundimonas sp.]|jgi:NADP-dependent 3-hydroxy acid dehydrogenase YdfG